MDLQLLLQQKGTPSNLRQLSRALVRTVAGTAVSQNRTQDTKYSSPMSICTYILSNCTRLSLVRSLRTSLTVCMTDVSLVIGQGSAMAEADGSHRCPSALGSSVVRTSHVVLEVVVCQPDVT